MRGWLLLTALVCPAIVGGCDEPGTASDGSALDGADEAAADDSGSDPSDGGVFDGPRDAEREAGADVILDLSRTRDDLDAPRPIAPMTGQHTASQHPTFRWALAPGTEGALVSLCRDRAMRTSCVTFVVSGPEGSPQIGLADGVWYWALHGVAGDAAGVRMSAVRRLFIGRSDHPGARAWGGDPDVNGDGYADIVGIAADGALAFRLGGPERAGAGAMTLAPAAEGGLQASELDDWRSLDYAGDVNGDGYGDVIACPNAPRRLVWLYLGGPEGLQDLPQGVAVTYGSTYAPTSTRALGDVDGDGYDDFVARYGNSEALVRGGEGPTLTVTTPVRDPSYGRVYAGLGDVDADGFDDVGGLLGGVYFGSSMGPRGLVGESIGVCSEGGDIDADGLADVFFAQDLQDSIRFGGASDGEPLDVRVSPWNATGDFNGDGFGDGVGQVGRGAVHAFGLTVLRGFLGSADRTLVPLEVPPILGSELRVISRAGDVDGDGYDDVLCREGGPFIVYGSSGGLDWPGHRVAQVVDPHSPTALVSYAARLVTSLGDVNGDGRAEVAALMTADGGLRVYYGQMGGVATAPSWTLARGAQPIVDVRDAGDVDCDGFADVLVMRESPDQVVIYRGSASGLGVNAPWTLSGVTGSLIQAQPLGDLNGDHCADVMAVGARGTMLFMGSRAGPGAPSVFTTALGSAPSYVRRAGDVNGDGLDDLIVWSAFPSVVQVFLGARVGAPTIVAATLDGALNLSPVGDVNGDHFADLAYVDRTRVAVLLGSASGPSARPAIWIDLDPAIDRGWLMPCGDLDADGYADICFAGEGTLQAIRGGPDGPTTDRRITRWYTGWVVTYTSSVTDSSRQQDGVYDVDGDGRGDVVAISETNDLVVLFGDVILDQPPILSTSAGPLTEQTR